jgi:hypothetical protein
MFFFFEFFFAGERKKRWVGELMGEGTESSSSMGGEKGLEDSSLPVNFHGNLASAHNDDELLNLLQQAKASKRTVSFFSLFAQHQVQ